MQDTTIAVDAAKSVLEVTVSHRPETVSERHRITRKRFARFLAERAPGTVVMETCGMAHYCDALRSPLAMSRLPAAHAAAIHIQHARDVYRSVALVERGDRALATPLELTGTALRSHVPLPPTGRVGHYLCWYQ